MSLSSRCPIAPLVDSLADVLQQCTSVSKLHSTGAEGNTRGQGVCPAASPMSNQDPEGVTRVQLTLCKSTHTRWPPWPSLPLPGLSQQTRHSGEALTMHHIEESRQTGVGGERRPTRNPPGGDLPDKEKPQDRSWARPSPEERFRRSHASLAPIATKGHQPTAPSHTTPGRPHMSGLLQRTMEPKTPKAVACYLGDTHQIC